MNKNKNNNNEIKKIITELKKKNDPSTEIHKHVFRPWGEFKNIHTEKGFQIKILIIYPKNKISLQYHNKRDQNIGLLWKARQLLQKEKRPLI